MTAPLDARVVFAGGPHDGEVRHVPPAHDDPTRPGEWIEVQAGVAPADPSAGRPVGATLQELVSGTYPDARPDWIRTDGWYQRRGDHPDDYGTWWFDWHTDLRPVVDDPEPAPAREDPTP